MQYSLSQLFPALVSNGGGDIRGEVAPQGTFGNVWGHFGRPKWGRRGFYWHLVGRSQGCC